MIPIAASIISSLLANNLPKLAQAVADKGLDYVQDKLGVTLKPDMTPEEAAAVRAEADKHEEFRITSAANLATAQEAEVTKRQAADMASDSWLSKNVRPGTLSTSSPLTWCWPSLTALASRCPSLTSPFWVSGACWSCPSTLAGVLLKRSWK